jgi:signal transduction histidine kinase
VLLAVALAGCLAVAALLRLLAHTPMLDLAVVANAQGQLIIGASRSPQAQPLVGQPLLAVSVPAGTPVAVDAALLHRVPRWQVDEGARARSRLQQQALSQALATGSVALHTGQGPPTVVPARTRGLAGLGLITWPLVLGALLLPLFGCIVMLARPSLKSGLFLLVCVTQALGLGWLAAVSLPGLGLPPAAQALGLPLGLALDAVAAAATVQGFGLAARGRRAGAAAMWLASAAGVAAIGSGLLQPSWPWAVALSAVLAGAVGWAVRQSPGGKPDPRRAITGRLALTALATWLLIHLVVALTASQAALAHAVALGAAVAWALLVVSLLLLVPFLARSRQLLRELALLAGISIVAAALDLLFVAMFSLNATASLAVVVFVALAVYAFVRQRLLDHLLGVRPHTTDRIFELLYRAARDVQRRPERQPQRLAQLLRELFEPLEMTRAATVPRQAQVQGGGTLLLVPLRAEGEDGKPGLAVQLRLAGRGQRLFMPEDARLADRLAEQLRRAVAYDRAVERGRHEERQRLAQDLHDDIGARLLTLMYQAPTPELEDYIRHTLQDLKTLTRGLAVAEHRLGPAAAEWKADLTQRLAAAQAQLGWACHGDEALVLTVVQWSALTRVLRELVTNALYHGRSTRVDVVIELSGAALSLSVADDGYGRQPAAWAHGLGLGGVRKRVKQLGGTVAWLENGDRGIVCRVHIPQFREGA